MCNSTQQHCPSSLVSMLHGLISGHRPSLTLLTLAGMTATKAGSSADGKKVLSCRDKDKNRIKNWFYNSKLDKDESKEKPVVLDLTKVKKKKIHPYQAYLRLYRDELKPLLDEQWEMQIKDLLAGAPPPECLVFTRKVAETFLAGEPDDVKAAVERAQCDNTMEMEEDEEARAKALRRTIAGIPKMIQITAENIERETG
ncbi:hypothetical protein QCA50_018895 [Cerrena zonata]|uniref:Uncharacterized protein n=1 Tax=Cerrena zonata TaxID=2478898 RepID=A0AAW0FLI1_9APHY